MPSRKTVLPYSSKKKHLVFHSCCQWQCVQNQRYLCCCPIAPSVSDFTHSLFCIRLLPKHTDFRQAFKATRCCLIIKNNFKTALAIIMSYLMTTMNIPQQQLLKETKKQEKEKFWHTLLSS